MLIDQSILIEKLRSHNIQLRGILHIGAHKCEELSTYTTWGVSPESVVWVDANPDLIQSCKARGIPNCFTAVLDESERDCDFFITNNGQSSSILAFGTHALSYPDVVVTETRKVRTQTLGTFLTTNSIDIRSYNVWNFDIQGVEYQVLNGAKDLLKYADAIYTEVNTGEVYSGCGKLHELDSLLGAHGFLRILTSMTRDQWGDALYIRIPDNAIIASPPAGAGLGNQMFHMAAAYTIASQTSRPLYVLTPSPNRNWHNLKMRDYTGNVFKVFGTPIPLQDHSQEVISLQATRYQQSSPHSMWSIQDIPSGRTILDGYFQVYPPLKLCGPSLTEKLLGAFSRIHEYEHDAFLHVRRGDFLEVPNWMYTQPLDYYTNAIEELRRKNPHVQRIIVVSDDIDWVLRQKLFRSPEFVVLKSDDELHTMQVMASCTEGAICANSTFSWWGAWIGAHSCGSPVIVPSRWSSSNPERMHPPCWIQL